MKCHKVSKDMKIYLKTNEEGGIFRNKSFIFKASIMGISLVWAIAVNPNLSVKFYNSIFSDSPQSSAGEILQSIKWFMKSENCLTTECILPGVSCGYLKWNFRKLCQHLFNLSSCETSSISHNPLSSYYCYWISSCRFCKMKLYFWCQASSNVVKLTIFYKEPFYSIQNPFVNFIALHVWGQFCLYWTDDVQYTNYTKKIHSSKIYQIVTFILSTPPAFCSWQQK